MRRVITLAATAALMAGATAFGATSAHAQGNDLGEYAFSLAATQALVNDRGGITVNGNMDCTAAINTALSDAAARVAGTGDTVAPITSSDGSIGANVGYTVTQYVGKTKANTAQYNSGIQQTCYRTNGQGPYPWKTLYGFPVGTQQWLYSATGKFTPGYVHVELVGESHVTIGVYDQNGNLVNTYTANLYSFAGADLKATMVKSR